MLMHRRLLLGCVFCVGCSGGSVDPVVSTWVSERESVMQALSTSSVEMYRANAAALSERLTMSLELLRDGRARMTQSLGKGQQNITVGGTWSRIDANTVSVILSEGGPPMQCSATLLSPSELRVE